jgi:hypothetical protein
MNLNISKEQVKKKKAHTQKYVKVKRRIFELTISIGSGIAYAAIGV